jgi:exosortase E/protease (VPEID-CTERM system)
MVQSNELSIAKRIHQLWAPEWHRTAVPLAVALEVIVLAVISTGKYSALRTSQHYFDLFLSYNPSLIKSIVFSTLAATTAFAYSSPQHFGELRLVPPAGRVALVFNAINFLLLLTIMAAKDPALATVIGEPTISRLFFLSTPVLWVTMLLSWAMLLNPIVSWRNVISQQRWIWSLTLSGSFLAFSGLDGLLAARVGAQLIEPTLFLATRIYAISGEKIAVLGVSAAGYPVFGNNIYAGEIQPSCSGYEGMVLTSLFLGIFFYVKRDRLAASQMIIIVLITQGAIYFLNALRLALLAYLGTHVSVEVATKGFHTNFGVLSLLIVILASVALASFFEKPRIPKAGPSPVSVDFARANVALCAIRSIPLALFISTSIVCGLFSGAFFWLYPIPILGASVGLFMIRNHLRALFDDVSPSSFGIGVLAFAVWIAAIPADAVKEQIFREALFPHTAAIIVSWMFFRVIGAIFVVPIAEELAFRGSITDLASNFLQQRFLNGKYIALILTSIGFGLMHNEVVAGSVAGFLFGMARLRRDQLGDAILAHAMTNLLLAFYVLIFSSWSYW